MLAVRMIFECCRKVDLVSLEDHIDYFACYGSGTVYLPQRWLRHSWIKTALLLQAYSAARGRA